MVACMSGLDAVYLEGRHSTQTLIILLQHSAGKKLIEILIVRCINQIKCTYMWTTSVTSGPTEGRSEGSSRILQF